MSDFDNFLSDLKGEVTALAESQLKNLKGEAVSGGQAFIQAMQADLKTWTDQLKAGQIDAEDLHDLVAGKKALAELLALKQAGLAQAALDKFVNGLIGIVVDCAVKAFV